MAFTLAQRLQSLSVPTRLGLEIQAQIAAGTGNRQRLMEASLPTLAAEYLAGAITAGTISAAKLSQYSVVPDVARLIAGALNAVPVNTVAPVLSGTPEVGQTLSVTNGTWTSQSAVTYAYAWYADSAVIAGATAATYELTASEDGATITVVVTATNANGSASETSNALGPVTEP